MYKNLSAVSIILMLASCSSSSANSPVKPNNDNRRTEGKIDSFVAQPAQVNGSQFTQELKWNVNGNPILSIDNKVVNVKGNSYIFTGEIGKVYKATLKCGIATKTIELGTGLVTTVKEKPQTAQQYVDALRSGERISKEGLDTILAALEADASKVKELIEKLESQIDKKIIDKCKKELEEISKKLENFRNIALDASQTFLNEIKGINKILTTIIEELKAKAEKAKLSLEELFTLNRKVNITSSTKSLNGALKIAQSHNLNSDEFKEIFKNLLKVDDKEKSIDMKAAITSANEIFNIVDAEKRDLTTSEIRTLVNNYNTILKEANAHEYYIEKLTFKRSSKELNRTLSSGVVTADSTAEEPHEFVLFLKESGIMEFIKAIFGELFDWGLNELKDAIGNTKSAEKFRINFAKKGTTSLEKLQGNLLLAQSYIKNYEEVFGKKGQLDEAASKIKTALNDVKKILENAKNKLVKGTKEAGEEIQQAAIKIQDEIIEFLIKHSKLAQQNVSTFFTWLQDKIEVADQKFNEIFDSIIAKLESSKRRESDLNEEEVLLLVKIQLNDLKLILEGYKSHNQDDKNVDTLLKVVNKVIESKAKTSEKMLKKVEKYRAESEKKIGSRNSSPSVPRKNSTNLAVSPSTNRKN